VHEIIKKLKPMIKKSCSKTAKYLNLLFFRGEDCKGGYE